jgi:hypothetical protein
MKMRLVLTIIAATALAACGANHGAEHGDVHDLDVHAHGATEAESWAVTAWGQHFELFPEIDALAAGKTAGAHVHVTVLDGFRPATEGSVTIVLRGAAGVEERFNATTAIRPGIFNVEIEPGTAGERELHFEIEVDGVRETIAGGTVRVGTADAPGGLVDQPHTLPADAGGERGAAGRWRGSPHGAGGRSGAGGGVAVHRATGGLRRSAVVAHPDHEYRAQSRRAGGFGA